MHLTTENVCTIAVAVSFLIPVVVHLLGATDSAAGKILLAIAAKRPPPGPDGEQPNPPVANPSQPSSSLIVGLVVASLFVTGCGATLKGAIASAVQAGEVSAAGLVVIRATVDSYFAQKPMPVLQASIDDLITNVAAADEALIRLGEGHDKISGGDIATAISRLVKAYDDLMQTLHTIGIVAPAGAAGDGEPIYVFRVGARTGQPAPSLPEIARGHR